MMPTSNWACEPADCGFRMSTVPERIEAERPQFKTLAQFKRTGVEKFRWRDMPDLFPDLLNESIQRFRTNLRAVGHCSSILLGRSQPTFPRRTHSATSRS